MITRTIRCTLLLALAAAVCGAPGASAQEKISATCSAGGATCAHSVYRLGSRLCAWHKLASAIAHRA